MDFLVDMMTCLVPYRETIESLKLKETPISVYGLTESATGHIVYALNQSTDRDIVLLAQDSLRARKIYEDIKNLGFNQVSLFTKKDIFLYDRVSKSYDNIIPRLKALNNLVNNNCRILITTIDALRDKIVSTDIFKNSVIKINKSSEIDIKELEKKLIYMGYERLPQVESRGQFAIRGGIIDIYTATEPVRIELFDIEVDSIRSFDIDTQRSVENLEGIEIIPITDILIKDSDKLEIADNLIKAIKRTKLKDERKERLFEKFMKYTELLKSDAIISNPDILIPFINKKDISSVLDYYNKEPLIIIEEPKRAMDKAIRFETEEKSSIAEMMEFGEALKEHEDVRYTYHSTIDKIRKNDIVCLNTLLINTNEFYPKSIFNYKMKSITNYRGKMNLFREDLKEYIKKGYKVIIFGGSEKRAKRLYNSLHEFEIPARLKFDRNAEINSSDVIITTGSLNAGFEISDTKTVVLNHSEIYGSQLDRKKINKKSKQLNFQDLTIGDYVIHESSGIGKYVGTQRLDIQGIKKDYIVIEYKGEDKLFLPVENLDSIYKYVGAEGKTPKINKLNSVEWKKTRAKARKNVEDMADDLIKLYAKRESIKGYAFSKDTNWQMEFEDSFMYEETNGQLKSSDEIKRDMEKDRPMDRLLCADVGYGKTEVALRAAFKAIMDGKQVAFLVPTTILAQQHYNTIVERFRDFPVNVALLSRFRTKKEQDKDLEGIKNGVIDIVVGTHRLLSKDVKFKDLGLLIIDEEQRFGVRHKEKLKMLKENIDTLTLTATPIPRTLQMSMIGIRDMSVIEEPPEERFPVQTYVLEYNDMMIRDAILKEIERGGQVYFVYNKVANMENKLYELRNLVPEAKFNMAHGQMSERVLEDTMISFINKEFDVLLCSTIIETGVDVQNANTMIIANANTFGLSQLYQLRGRIGRSNRIAYAYFTYERDTVLSEIAQKRLKSIKEFTDFGSGYKIAMRDLEIRGSGSILGSRQHGHIEAIGYDLYIKYLKDAVAKLKGEKVEEKVETTVDIKIDCFIPKKYIADDNLRLEIYKKISVVESEDEYQDLVDELIDRFSDIPKEVSNLMDISLLRHNASLAGILSIIQKRDRYEFKLSFIPDINLINDLKGEYRTLKLNMTKEPIFEVSGLKYPVEDLKKIVSIIKLHKNNTTSAN